MRPAHLERSSTVRLPDYLRWHGAAQLGTPRAKLAQIAYGLLPRDVFISVEQRTPGNLDPDEWAILRRVIDLIKTNANGAELGPVLETIENALRADQAISIAALSDLADRRRGSTGDLFAEFKANRELIEAIASALFDQSSNVETRVVSIFSKHIPSSRFGRRHSVRLRPRRTVK